MIEQVTKTAVELIKRLQNDKKNLEKETNIREGAINGIELFVEKLKEDLQSEAAKLKEVEVNDIQSKSKSKKSKAK